MSEGCKKKQLRKGAEKSVLHSEVKRKKETQEDSALILIKYGSILSKRCLYICVTKVSETLPCVTETESLNYEVKF